MLRSFAYKALSVAAVSTVVSYAWEEFDKVLFFNKYRNTGSYLCLHVTPDTALLANETARWLRVTRVYRNCLGNHALTAEVINDDDDRYVIFHDNKGDFGETFINRGISNSQFITEFETITAEPLKIQDVIYRVSQIKQA